MKNDNLHEDPTYQGALAAMKACPVCGHAADKHMGDGCTQAVCQCEMSEDHLDAIERHRQQFEVIRDSQRERRRYALLQAAATIFASLNEEHRSSPESYDPDKTPYTQVDRFLEWEAFDDAVKAAIELLAEIERKEAK